MSDTAAIADLLHEAGETHHVVYRIVDGDDPDWASWYADWLLDHSELPQLLGGAPIRSHLVYELVGLDRDYTAEPREERWADWYAQRLLERFGGSLSAPTFSVERLSASSASRAAKSSSPCCAR